ncbi:dynamin family protein [Rhodococcus sp. Q]|uniref:dynamin family protein n=1 Tax=Rhodococcus sp. Q TaxID=2502252 RepID=UPI0010F80495|nr:dynamin family protein [Rhodococcus sp. Q]
MVVESAAGTGVSTSAEDPAAATLTKACTVLRKCGYTAVAELAERKASTELQVQSIVVVGEVKRGKSSLVNALVAERNASPVDVASSTSATVHLAPPAPGRVPGTVELLFPGQPRAVDRSELADWVSTAGARVVDRGTETLPTGAVVTTRADTFGGAVVVDTPGVGGLDPSHAQLAMRTAQRACVLVVTCDATTPLTAPEMEFLRDATATVDSVVVAVTKTDKNLRRWRPIVDENRRLLQKHLRRPIPVVGVSSLRAVEAAERTDPEARAAGEESSGIAELRRHIRARLALGENLPTVDGLRTALEGLRKVHATFAEDLAIAQNSAAVLPELTAERDRLQELKDHSGQWEHYLGRDLTLARQSALTFLDEQLEQIRESWTNRINKSGVQVLRRNPQHFTAQIESELRAAMAATVQRFLDQTRAAVTPLFGSDVQWEEIQSRTLGGLDPQLRTGQVASKSQGLLDPSILTMGMIGTSMLGAVIGVGAVAGVVWVGVNLGYKALRSGKTNLLTWLRETLGTARTSTARLLEAALSTARPEVVIRYREHLVATIAQVQQRITDAKDAARLDEATREQTVKRLSTNVRAVTATIAEVENLIGRLAATTEGRSDT